MVRLPDEDDTPMSSVVTATDPSSPQLTMQYCPPVDHMITPWVPIIILQQFPKFLWHNHDDSKIIQCNCPDYQGVLIIKVSWLSRCPDYQGVLIIKVSWLSRCPHYQSVLIFQVSLYDNAPFGTILTHIHIETLRNQAHASLWPACAWFKNRSNSC